MVERTTSDPIVGRLLDRRYEVGPRVARGGMATVYEARDLRLDRTVAVKVMHGGLGEDHDFSARFVREARAAARLSHPNVVSVFDQGDDNGTLFLAMEYVPGHTLRDLLRQEAPVSPTRALALLEPVLSALAAAHAAGLVHRDVKPENVLIADDGRVKVADFGLARAVSAETQHTATGGVLIGTVSYLAPELVVDGVADARADVYAAGVMLYELLTATKPHDGDSPIQIAYKHVHEDVPPPSAKVPRIPPYVDALVARATARDRGQRPADAQVLLHHVHRVRHALDGGLRDDPELTADLAPRALPTGREDTTDLGLEDDDRRHTAVVPLQRPPVDAADAAAARTPPRERRGGRRRRGVVLALVAVLLAVAGTAGWWFGFARYTTTPGVINLSVAAAEKRVESAGLRLEVGDEEFSETVTAGLVLRTDPAAGSRILDDGTVTAVVSLGPERYEVPDLRGQSESDASEALTERNLEPGDVLRRYHERIDEGAVIRTAPAAGTELRKGMPVDLVVSRGPRPIDVPDLTGRAADGAESELDGLGLGADVRRAFDDDVPEGRVISQNPSSGTLLRGDTVQLVVSRGPELVEVPRLRGVGVQEATRRLEAAGFEVATRRSSLYVGIEYVVSSDPAQGTMAPRGSTVTLSLV